MDISQSATAFLIADVARHKQVQRRLLEEIDSNSKENITLVDDLSTTFPYLHEVMKESARMWPALALTLPERTVKDSTIIGGHVIPKDVRALVLGWEEYLILGLKGVQNFMTGYLPTSDRLVTS